MRCSQLQYHSREIELEDVGPIFSTRLRPTHCISGPNQPDPRLINRKFWTRLNPIHYCTVLDYRKIFQRGGVIEQNSTTKICDTLGSESDLQTHVKQGFIQACFGGNFPPKLAIPPQEFLPGR